MVFFFFPIFWHTPIPILLDAMQQTLILWSSFFYVALFIFITLSHKSNNNNRFRNIIVKIIIKANINNTYINKAHVMTKKCDIIRIYINKQHIIIREYNIKLLKHLFVTNQSRKNFSVGTKASRDLSHIFASYIYLSRQYFSIKSSMETTLWHISGVFYRSHCVKSVQIRSYLWSVFSCIRTEYGDLWSRKIRTRNNSVFWHFPRSVKNRIKYKRPSTNSFITHFLGLISIRKKLHYRILNINGLITYFSSLQQSSLNFNESK